MRDYRETPDHVKEAERAVIGTILLENYHYQDIENIITAECFSDHRLRGIYRAIQSLILKGEPADIITVKAELQGRTNIDPIFIEGLTDDIPMTQNIKAYAQIIQDYHRRYDLAEQAENMLQRIDQDPNIDPDKLIQNFIDHLEDGATVHDDGLEPWTFEDMVQEFRKTREGLKTGISGLDKKVRIKPGAITIIAGRPGEGKTTLLYNIMLRMAKENPKLHFLFMSYEEAKKKLAKKMLINLSGIVLSKDPGNNQEEFENMLRNPGYTIPEDSMAGWLSGTEDLSDLLKSGRVTINDRQPDIMSLVRILRGFSRRYGENAGPVFIDYVQQIPNRDKAASTRQVIIQDISNQIKKAAIRLDLPIVMAAQLNREAQPTGKNGGEGFPYISMSRVRESGDIEQDANTIITIQMSPDKRTVGLHVVKNREGETSVPGENPIYLDYDAPVLRMEDGRVYPGRIDR